MPDLARKPRRRRGSAATEPAFDGEWAAFAACDAARALPEPERSERLRELRPALRRHVLQTWKVIPNVNTDEWLEEVVERHYIVGSIFRPCRPPPHVLTSTLTDGDD
jgi:hypothetical protein